MSDVPIDPLVPVEIYADLTLFRKSINLHIVQRHIDGRVFVATNATMELVPAATMLPPRSLITIDNKEAQSLMDQLWSCGLRPSEGSGSAGALAATQRHLLQALWPLVLPGGRLLFCTCSLFRAEGDEQVQAFLANNTDARLLPSPGHLLPRSINAHGVVADNPLGDHDGFFYALFEKRAA